MTTMNMWPSCFSQALNYMETKVNAGHAFDIIKILFPYGKGVTLGQSVLYMQPTLPKFVALSINSSIIPSLGSRRLC